MKNTQAINGWTYKKGDYHRDSNYDDAFMAAQRKYKLIKRVLYSVLGVVSLGTFIMLLSLIKN